MAASGSGGLWGSRWEKAGIRQHLSPDGAILMVYPGQDVGAIPLIPLTVDYVIANADKLRSILGP